MKKIILACVAVFAPCFAVAATAEESTTRGSELSFLGSARARNFDLNLGRFFKFWQFGLGYGQAKYERVLSHDSINYQYLDKFYLTAGVVQPVTDGLNFVYQLALGQAVFNENDPTPEDAYHQTRTQSLYTRFKVGIRVGVWNFMGESEKRSRLDFELGALQESIRGKHKAVYIGSERVNDRTSDLNPYLGIIFPF